MIRVALAVIAWLLTVSAAGALELAGEPFQGALITGTVDPGARVTIDRREVRVDPATGRFVFGIPQDRRGAVRIEVLGPGDAAERFDLPVKARTYDIERIDGLPPRKVTPNPDDLDRIRNEARLINAARARNSEGTQFEGGFIWPVTGRISGRYGNQRILNGEPRRPHLGVDIAAPRGTPVAASAAGTVSLAEADLFFTGGTVVLDHGHGVTTIYSHLATIGVSVGDTVIAGQQVGTVGSTGRSTGPHLDWRINWFSVRLDPELIAGPMPTTR